MQEYFFLFFLALVWTVFASVQDIRKREVANWLTFSLVAFGLVYRGFYALLRNDAGFFLWGLAGFALFYLFAVVFYYGRVFAGGDAKLLMGYGVILPINGLGEILVMGGAFLFLLFFVGAVYSFIFSFFVVRKSPGVFFERFVKIVKASFVFLVISTLFALIIFFLTSSYFLLALLLALPWLYLYLYVVDSCMIVRLGGRALSEGDWLAESVRVKGKLIKKSVHGLSWKDIKLLRSAKKKVFIKQGIPFVPSFLLALLIMGYVWVVSGGDLLAYLIALW